MIRHVVMWKLLESAEGRTRSENAQVLKNQLETLRDEIPQIESLEVGINFNSSEKAFDLVLISEFRDKEALERYQKHPAHQALIANLLSKIRSEKAVVDFEIS